MSEGRAATITDKLRKLTGPALDGAGGFLARLGVHPDAITIAGALLSGLAALLIASGDFLAGGVVLLLGLPLDALDGAVARALRRRGAFGMMLDSTLDRYADGFVFAALAFYFAQMDRPEMLVASLMALIGSFLVSYARARADDSLVNVRVTVGLFTRLERVALILLMTLGAGLSGDARLLDIGVVILAIGTNWTALQRLWFVRRVLRERESGETD